MQPPTTGTYIFYTDSDDGVRLWVNGTQVVDNWTDHSRTENSGTVALTAGVRYRIRMEFYENGGDAVARLSWSGPSVAKAVVPRSALFSRFAAKVNFQPAGAPVPAGYLVDAGAVSPAHERRPLRMERGQRGADARPQHGQLARPALRHAHAPPEAGQPERGSGRSRCRTAPTPCAWSPAIPVSSTACSG